MGALARELKNLGLHPEQVQDFTPTPMTLATAMYYLGFDPYTDREVHVTRDIGGKRRQKEYFFKAQSAGQGARSRGQGAWGQGQVAGSRQSAVSKKTED
jgi:radical SAM superfamily enzyme YgiQ (UPF0313 family)